MPKCMLTNLNLTKLSTLEKIRGVSGYRAGHKKRADKLQ